MGALLAMSGRPLAETPVAKPADAAEWSSPAKDLPKDPDPLKDELIKYPRCRYCGMYREKFSHTRMLIAFDDQSVDVTCSLRCAALSLTLYFRNGPKEFYVGDFGSDEPVKPLIRAETAHFVIDPSKPGTMTKVSKAAYSDRTKAEAAAAAEASAKAGARVVGFEEALKESYAGMGDGMVGALKRRNEKRQQEGKQ